LKKRRPWKEKMLCARSLGGGKKEESNAPEQKVRRKNNYITSTLSAFRGTSSEKMATHGRLPEIANKGQTQKEDKKQPARPQVGRKDGIQSRIREGLQRRVRSRGRHIAEPTE